MLWTPQMDIRAKPSDMIVMVESKVLAKSNVADCEDLHQGMDDVVVIIDTEVTTNTVKHKHRSFW